MVLQHFIVSMDESGLVYGFMTFRHGYACPELRSIGASNYITTICVRKVHRNKGVLKGLYAFLLSNMPHELAMNYLSTRTWSTNAGHIHTLETLGFQRVTVVPDDRKPGIDTVYYAKALVNT